MLGLWTSSSKKYIRYQLLIIIRTERERGITIETTMWNIKLNNYDLDIIDAPGHKDFIKNMSVGASLADCAILIVSAAPSNY
jgi:elongation factor 1-alpha